MPIRNPLKKHDGSVEGESRCRNDSLFRSWVVLGFLSIWAAALGGRALAQPPGTIPPADVLRPSTTSPQDGRIPIRGFLFLDETMSTVMVPRMTYEQLNQLETGAQSQSVRFSFEQVSISGQMDRERVEMSVVMQLTVESTEGEMVAIPLAMDNFHRLSETEFVQGLEKVDRMLVAIDPQTGEHQLLVATNTATTISMRMKMSARVKSDSTKSLDFRLPVAPTKIDLISDDRDVIGEIPNRDDEVISTSTEKSGRSRFRIESGGGRFTLRWGGMQWLTPVSSLETESNVSIQWNSPRDRLIQNVKLQVRDSRGPVSSFQLRLPEGSVLVDDPRLASSGQFIELSRPDADDEELFEIKIPKNEQQQRVIVDVRLQLPNEGVSESGELSLQVPTVVGTLLDQGTIDIETGTDYRLRWREKPYIQNLTSTSVDDASTNRRKYSFNFTRGTFSLPIWLDATKRELRVSSDCEIELRDNYATLVMQIRPLGSGNRARLLSVDLMDWQSIEILNARTRAPLAWYESGDAIEIEIGGNAMDDVSPVLINARRTLAEPTLEDPEPSLDMRIPRVVGSGDRREPVTIQESNVNVVGRGRRSLVIDLERSDNLQRATIVDESDDNEGRRFVVVPPESSARIVGELVQQPPRLVLKSDVTVSLLGNQLETVVSWSIQSPIDLQGRLRIAIPGEASPEWEGKWSVLVDGRVAQIRPLSETVSDESSLPSPRVSDASVQYDLISDSLRNGVMELRFRHLSAPLLLDEQTELPVALRLPYPVVDDITLQDEIEIEFLAENHRMLFDERSTAVGTEVPNRTSLASLPTSSLNTRILPRQIQVEELDIERAVILSTIGGTLQYDQVIASVKGTGDFVLQFPSDRVPDFEVQLDGEDVLAKQVGNQLIVAIRSDLESRTVEVKLWDDRLDGSLFSEIQPLANLDRVNSQIDWQVKVPADSHLVWASFAVGRAMVWVFDRWCMVRQPIMSETELVARITSNPTANVNASGTLSGNRYLFTAMDDQSFRIRTASRTTLWLLVAGLTVLLTSIVTYLPGTRNPLAFSVLVVGFAGLLLIAPDTAVMIGQIAMLALVLVIVMLSIRQLVVPPPSRVLADSANARRDGSQRSTRSPAPRRGGSSVARTQTVTAEDIVPASSEVAS